MHRTTLLAIGVIIIMLASGVATYYFVTPKTNTRQIRVACVGDSITEGSGYPNKLNLLLGSNYTVRNFGVSGTEVALNLNKPYMNESKFQDALDFDPDIIVIMLGTNDAKLDVAQNEQSFEADYTQLVNSFQELAGDEQIFVVKSPPIFNNNANYSNTILANTVIPHIDNLANQMNLPTIDIYDSLINHSDYFWDGVHPKSEGATIIASTVYNAITSQDSSGSTP
jgi:lysophospholipase L1-like esterase